MQEHVAAAQATVEIHRRAEPVLAAWAALETSAPCSVYQTRAWLLPWIETLGRKAGLQPLFVLARAPDGSPVALLCLGTRTTGPLRTATWLGGKDANVNLALLHAGVDWTADELRALLERAARTCGREAPDLLVLPNQPASWGGRPNPMWGLKHQPSPSFAHGTTLTRDAEALFAARLSKDARKKLRKKEARLAAAFGPVTHVVARATAERAAIIDAFLAQKIARFRDLGIASDLDAPEMRAFLDAASRDAGGLELHALKAGERIVAVFGGGAHAGHWSGMFNAFDADEEVARSSPGDLLLMRIVARLCAEGITRFDLGIGEARYKAALCDEAIALFDAFVPLTKRGHVIAHVLAARQRAKRAVKQSPRFLALATRLRAAKAAMGRSP